MVRITSWTFDGTEGRGWTPNERTDLATCDLGRANLPVNSCPAVVTAAEVRGASGHQGGGSLP